MVMVAALGALVVTQVASAQPAQVKKPLKVRMINPFYQGIAVKPPTITYFINNNAVKATASGLDWQGWGGSRATATGRNEDGEQVEVVLSAKRRCGLPNMLFYTRIKVDGQTSPLQCKVQVVSATNIGKATEDVYGFHTLNRYDIWIPPMSAGITRGKWHNLGKPVLTGRGVASAWWSQFDFRWVPALMIQSNLGYCAQLGAIVYRKVRLSGYGNGIEEGSIPISRAAPLLRKQIGHGAKHSLRYNYTKWCRLKKYPVDYWTSWE